MNTGRILLSGTAHRTHGWRRYDNYAFAAAEVLAPLVLQEVAEALARYPLAFVKDAAGHAHLVAVLGLEPGRNLFVDPRGTWRGGYVPSCYRGYPFFLQPQPGDAQRAALGFDLGSRLYREQPDVGSGEERFFDDEGRPQPLVQRLVGFLQAVAQDQRATRRAVALLARSSLLVPWDWPGRAANQPGLYRADETGLAALSPAQLGELRDASALRLAYAQILSIPRQSDLQRLAAQVGPASTSAGMPDASIVQAIFGQEREDALYFDW